MERAGGILIIGVMGLLAFAFLWLFKEGVANVWRGHASQSWPTADAVVAAADASSTGSNINNRPTTSIHRVTLAIRYTVGGDSFTTEQITWGQTLGTSDPSDAALLGLRYRVGHSLRVYYNPEEPSQTVVLPGIHASAFFLPGVALTLLALVVPGMAFGLRSLSAVEAEQSGMSAGMMRSIRVALLAFLIVGAVLLTVGYKDVSQALSSHSWQTAEGEWMKRVREDFNGPPPADYVAPPEARSGVEYVYRYVVNGNEHYNNVRRFGQGTAGGSEADAEIEARFTRGGPLKVYYDPVDPRQSVLVPGISWRIWVVPTIGLVLLSIGALAFAPWKRSSPAPSRAVAHALTKSEESAPGRPRRARSKERRK